MHTKTRYIIKHKDGGYLHVSGELYEDFMKGTKWNSEDEITSFMRGYYAPDNPDEYVTVKINITYELEE